MTIVPPGFAHVIQPIFNVVSTQRYSVTYGIQHTADPAEYLQLATDVDQLFRERWGPHIDGSFQMHPAELTIGNDGPPIVVVSVESPSNGGRAGEVTPPNFATIIRKRTIFGGRAFRGRLFMPALAQDAEVDETGRIATSRVASLQTTASLWLSQLLVGTEHAAGIGPTPMVLLHDPPVSGGVPPVPTTVTSLQVQILGGTQRRRMRR